MKGRRPVTARDALYVMFLHRTAIVTLFLAAVIISYIYCLLTPDVYRAEARLVVGIGRTQVPSIDWKF